MKVRRDTSQILTPQSLQAKVLDGTIPAYNKTKQYNRCWGQAGQFRGASSLTQHEQRSKQTLSNLDGIDFFPLFALPILNVQESCPSPAIPVISQDTWFHIFEEGRHGKKIWKDVK